MKNSKWKHIILSAGLGASGFIAPYSLMLIIFHLTKFTEDLYPLKYLVFSCIVFTVVWFYCFHTLKALRIQR